MPPIESSAILSWQVSHTPPPNASATTCVLLLALKLPMPRVVAKLSAFGSAGLATRARVRCLVCECETAPTAKRPAVRCEYRVENVLTYRALICADCIATARGDVLKSRNREVVARIPRGRWILDAARCAGCMSHCPQIRGASGSSVQTRAASRSTGRQRRKRDSLQRVRDDVHSAARRALLLTGLPPKGIPGTGQGGLAMAKIEAYQTKSGERWRVRYRTPDRRQTDKRGFTTKRDAERFASTVEVTKMRGEYVAPSLGRVTTESWGRRGCNVSAGI